MKLKNTIAKGIALVLLGGGFVQAQDSHYSQYFNAPLNVNPALTGVMNGKLRAGINFRQQWQNVPDSYGIGGASFDMKYEGFGIGAIIINEGSAASSLNRFAFGLTGSYDFMKETDDNHLLVGVHLGLINKSFDGSGLTFGNPNNSNGGAPVPVDVGISNQSFLVPDLGLGLMWFNGSATSSVNPFMGVSVMHLNRPKDSFDGSDILPSRLTVHGGFTIGTDIGVDITPHGQYMSQARASSTILGVNVGYNLNSFDASLVGGLSYRFEDAFIPYLGISYKDFLFGFSYDANTSQLSDVMNLKQSFEFSLTYIITDRSYKPKFICPRL
ncbi:MAG: type IX secretion system PorP/SprF family membrane protein [Flavobacteriales bacterium]|jgi:type IX secretion system PorP/SprF family membrane protein